MKPKMFCGPCLPCCFPSSCYSSGVIESGIQSTIFKSGTWFSHVAGCSRVWLFPAQCLTSEKFCLLGSVLKSRPQWQQPCNPSWPKISKAGLHDKHPGTNIITVSEEVGWVRAWIVMITATGKSSIVGLHLQNHVCCCSYCVAVHCLPWQCNQEEE